MTTYRKTGAPSKKDDQSKGNILADPELRKKFKASLVTLTAYHRQMDDLKESLKEAIGDLAAEYGIEKKHIGRMAKTMYKANYSSLLEENRHFEVLYETVVEGRLRDPDDTSVVSPLDGDSGDE